MLYDKGLATPEQIEKYNNFMSARSKGILNGTWPGGCVDSAICEKCNHLIVDSLCLCGGRFTCPNCGTKNGEKFINIIPQFSNKLDFVNSDLQKKYEICYDICSRIYINRNIALNEAGIIEQLKRIDKLFRETDNYN